MLGFYFLTAQPLSQHACAKSHVQILIYIALLLSKKKSGLTLVGEDVQKDWRIF